MCMCDLPIRSPGVFPADELTAAGKTGEEIAAELGVSPATLYNWRRGYGGMDTDAAKEHRRAPRHRTQEGVRRGRRAAEGAADGQRTRTGFASAATLL
jgi:transposase-like protein